MHANSQNGGAFPDRNKNWTKNRSPSRHAKFNSACRDGARFPRQRGLRPGNDPPFSKILIKLALYTRGDVADRAIPCIYIYFATLKIRSLPRTPSFCRSPRPLSRPKKLVWKSGLYHQVHRGVNPKTRPTPVSKKCYDRENGQFRQPTQRASWWTQREAIYRDRSDQNFSAARRGALQKTTSLAMSMRTD